MQHGAKILITAALIVGFMVAVPAKDKDPARTRYDAVLAKKLGADEYGMKMYTLVLLRGGANTSMSKEATEQVFAGHMANIQRLAANGQLVFAGPLEKNDRYRGIFVFNVATQAEAEAMLATDPAIKAGALAGDFYQLYGSAALQEVNAIHRRIAKSDP
jgi:uncharacterized protein